MGTSPATGQEMEWEESWNAMEPFGVTVVPTDSDLFQDMQPVLTKTRKVCQATPPIFYITANCNRCTLEGKEQTRSDLTSVSLQWRLSLEVR